MYSRNYGRGDISAKITPPPAYSGSAIQGGEASAAPETAKESRETHAFAPFSQSVPLPKLTEEEAECAKVPPCEENSPQAPKCEEGKKSSLLSGVFSDLSTEDLILIGIIAALAFDLADRDILLVALVIAVVLM